MQEQLSLESILLLQLVWKSGKACHDRIIMHIAHSKMTAAPVIQSKQQFYFQKTITEKISMGDFQCHNSESAWSL